MALDAVEIAVSLDRLSAVLLMVGTIDHKRLESLVLDDIEKHVGPLDEDVRTIAATAVHLAVARIVAGVVVAVDTA